VQLRGRASFYAPRGRLQWIADVARPAGQGALLEALEKLKQKLVSEGLTDPERKRRLPSDPRRVGVVTSATGAAFSDIVTVARRRGRVSLLLSPAVVQGDGAPESILRALDLLERAGPDVIIIGRGGGSAEDLMAFNDERVVRRVASCNVPIVSAVGHEIDFALTDLVADARAATPSQAAEMVVPNDQERRAVIGTNMRHLARAMRSRLTETQLAFGRCQSKLSDPRFLVAEGQQTLDDLRVRLAYRARVVLKSQRLVLQENVRRLYARHPRAVLARARLELTPLRQRLGHGMERKLDQGRARLGAHGRSLTALSPLSILGRGYALATTASGEAIRDVADLTVGEDVTVRVKRGTFVSQVQKVLSTVENHDGFAHESPAADAAGEEGS
jgi:exodeoxyribonuclease VII large subunit